MTSIYTIGHSNHTAEIFLSLLESAGIQMVVDVRTAPYSRYVPRFNKLEIERTLVRAGFKYLYLGDVIGGKPKVLATGGGAFMTGETRALIAERAVSVWLKADLELLVSRTVGRSHRPLLNTGDPRATLAGLIQRPESLSPLRHPERARTRRNRVLDRMAAVGFLDPATAAQAKASPPQIPRHIMPIAEPKRTAGLHLLLE